MSSMPAILPSSLLQGQYARTASFFRRESDDTNASFASLASLTFHVFFLVRRGRFGTSIDKTMGSDGQGRFRELRRGTPASDGATLPLGIRDSAFRRVVDSNRRWLEKIETLVGLAENLPSMKSPLAVEECSKPDRDGLCRLL